MRPRGAFEAVEHVAAGTALGIFVDELQDVKEEELAALITALHRAAQRRLPVVPVGAGLPQLRGRRGRAKSYAERPFDFPEIGALPPPAAKLALSKPANEQGVDITDEALEKLIAETRGYPYFVPEWGKHSWDTAANSPIRVEDVVTASTDAVAVWGETPNRQR